MGTSVKSWPPVARAGAASGFVLAAALVGSGCGGAPPPRAAPATEPSACLGGLCVRPDHVVARRTGEGRHARCLIVAWDGDGSLPPTAQIGVHDRAPARPGVFAAIDLPSFAAWSSYPITSDPTTSRTGAGVFAARVDPAVRFADHRVADGGSVRVEPLGSAAIVLVSSTIHGQHETARFLVPDAANECLARLR